MYNKYINTMPLIKIDKETVTDHSAQTSNLKRQNKILQNAGNAGAFNPPLADTKADLSTKKVSHSNPFMSFLYFILHILQALIGSDKKSSAPTSKNIPETPRMPIHKETVKKNPEQTVLQQYEQKIRSLIPSSMPQDLAEQFIKTQLDQAKDQNPAKIKDLFSPSHKKALVFELLKLQAIKYYSDSLLVGLKHMYAEQKADEVFHQIYPAYHASMQELLANSMTDVRELKKPLAVIAKKLIAEFEKPVFVAPVDEKIAEVKKRLKNLQKDLAQGALIPVREHISKKYPGLEEQLAAMPAQKKEFELILSRAWIKNELRNLIAYQGTKFEYNVLKNLGYDVSSYDDKKFLQEALETCFNTTELPPIEDLPKAFKKWAFDIRARAAGVPEKALSNLRALLRFYSTQKEELTKKAEDALEGLKFQCRLPKAQEFMEARFHFRNLTAIHHKLEELLNTHKNDIREKLSSADPKDFSGSLPRLNLDFKGSLKELPQDLRKADAWFSKYGNMIIGEFSQGEDDENEALGDGVCLGLAYRMANASLQSPTDPVRGIAVRSIEPSDRQIQAYHMLNSRVPSNGLLPPKLLAERGQKERLLFKTSGDMNVRDALIKQLQDPGLKESNGGIMLGWDGHETFMRFDLERNKFFFFDPNFNTMVFIRKTDETPQELATRMVTAYLELHQWAYPTRKTMDGHQIASLKKSTVT
jgi:hypothetical protein